MEHGLEAVFAVVCLVGWFVAVPVRNLYWRMVESHRRAAHNPFSRPLGRKYSVRS